MNKKTISIAAALIFMASVSQAQYIEDALRFSQPEYGSTARFKAMGGTSTSLGGDLSAIAGNPAGLGFFNTSDAGISLNYLNDKNTSNYYGTSTSSQAEKLSLSQAGVVFNMPIRSQYQGQTGWRNFNIGIGYVRTNDFNSAINFNGENNNNSYADFLADAGGLFGEWGEESFLLDVDADNFYYPSTSERYTNNQINSDIRKGSQYQTNFSFGANYNNNFYIGASIGIAGFNYTSQRKFSEGGIMKDAAEFAENNLNSKFLDPSNAASAFVGADYDLSFSSFQQTNGAGFNGTLGMIYRPNNMFQIGLSATTPTWYTVTDDYSMYFDGWIVDPNTQQDLNHYQSDEEKYYDEYDLRTPYRLNAGVSAIFQQGLITADIEFVDYKSMKITTNDHDANIQSANTINSEYKSAANFRLGGEYKLTPAFLLRAGYNYRGNPYKNISSTKQTVSGGLGYRINNMYVDLTYLNEQFDYEYTPYQSDFNPTNPAAISNMRNNVLLTVGFKF